jgi:hypothetical protein
MTRLAAVLCATLVQLVCLVPAGAATSPDEIAAALAADPVFVDPAANPTLTASEAARLRDAIDASDARPIFIAVVGDSALEAVGGDPQVLVDRIADDHGIAGAYAVVAEGRFRAAGRGTTSAAAVARAADAAFDEGRSRGVAGVLEAFVRRLDDANGTGTGLPTGPLPEGSAAAGRGAVGDTGFALFGLGGLLLPLLLLGGAFVFVRRLVRRRSFATVEPEQEELPGPAGDGRPFADVRALAEQDVLDLGSEIYELDPEVHTPAAPRAALDEFRLAVGHYDRAQELLAAVEGADDLGPVTEAIEEGRYSLAATRARLRRQGVARAAGPLLLRSAPRSVDHGRRVGATRRRSAARPRLRHGRRARAPWRRSRGAGARRRWSAHAVLGRAGSLPRLGGRMVRGLRRSGLAGRVGHRRARRDVRRRHARRGQRSRRGQ